MRLFIRVLLVVVALGWCESGAGRIRAVRGWVPRPARILVVTAHPDDEVLLAPYLASQCVEGTASCSILVLTRGEGGGDPEVRTREMALSAALLNLRLTQWSLPDLMTPWPDRETLVRQVRDVIAIEHPDLVLTFDPAHGSTGHPAHRETGSIVLDTGAANVYLLETLASFAGDGFELSGAESSTWVIHAGPEWEFAVRAAAIHASQFSAAQVESLRTLPADQRKVWLRQAP
jgi:LmbE family N-acetylglucosaminyl deacetylase